MDKATVEYGLIDQVCMWSTLLLYSTFVDNRVVLQITGHWRDCLDSIESSLAGSPSLLMGPFPPMLLHITVAFYGSDYWLHLFVDLNAPTRISSLVAVLLSLAFFRVLCQGAELRNTTVQLRLMWDHMPLTGRLFMDSVPMSTFQLPGEYTSDKGGRR